jgi:NitT/TauT family transport system substrate-binding protein
MHSTRNLLRTITAAVAIGVAVAGPGCKPQGQDEPRHEAAAAPRQKLRVGHFPNLTHAQALVAHALSRRGQGWFEERLGVEIEWYVYNAGPSAMEAIFSGSLDVSYVGPNPALNAYAKARGEEIRVLAGSALGGAALVVHGDDRLRTAADFRGKKVATPQLGNTQDVACRVWLQSNGLKVTQTGGDVHVLPTANPDQLALFQARDIDAVWTVEPWVSRLEMEAGGKVLVEEEDSLTTILVTSVGFLKERGELAHEFARAHAELTEWVKANPQEAQRIVREELKAETTREMPADLILRSWPRLKFTSEIALDPLEKLVTAARSVGFLQDMPDLSRLVVGVNP